LKRGEITRSFYLDINSIFIIFQYILLFDAVIVRYNDKPWFTSEIRKEIRIRDRLLKVILKYHRNSDICKNKKQRNRINKLRKIAKENIEIYFDNIILENASNNKIYWKIMKMLLMSK
jgi:hypothetical protein